MTIVFARKYAEIEQNNLPDFFYNLDYVVSFLPRIAVPRL